LLAQVATPFPLVCMIFRVHAGLHDGLEDELIYFVPDRFFPHAFVYSMRDGAVKPFGFESQPASFCSLEETLGFPVWLFPSK
jgi:hypothetical protein